MRVSWLRVSAACMLVASVACSYFFFYAAESLDSDMEITPSAFQEVSPVRQGTNGEVVYRIHNCTTVPIHIIAVETSCSCAGLELPKRTLVPGEQILLCLKYSIGGRRRKLSIRGMIAHRREGETQARMTPIGVVVGIDPDFAVDPPELTLGDGHPLVQYLSISPRHVPDVGIIKATCNLRFFAVSVLPKDAVSNRQRIEVVFMKNEYYADAGFAWLTVLTDCPSQPTLRVPLSVVTAK